MSFYYISLHFFTCVLQLHLPTLPLPNCLSPFCQHVKTLFYHFVCNSLCLTTPGDLSTRQKTFYPSVATLLYYYVILPSFAKSSCFTAQNNTAQVPILQRKTPDIPCIRLYLQGRVHSPLVTLIKKKFIKFE